MKMILQLLKINGLKMVKNILIMELAHGGTAVMKICLKEKELMSDSIFDISLLIAFVIAMSIETLDTSS